MSRFSLDWLRLREPADVAARNASVADAVAARFSLRDSVRVVDLGSGTGANLRSTSQLLPHNQSWLLIDNDASLLTEAHRELVAWADTAEIRGSALQLNKGSTQITAEFKVLDLALDLAEAFNGSPELVTASAFCDLVSEAFIKSLTRGCAAHRTPFYSVLTYNGLQRWSPHRPGDNQIAGAFHRHQLRDKGFGTAVGPMAAEHLADQFRLNGYVVVDGDSPWLLDRNDRMLINELVHGYATAAAETGSVDAKTIESWIKVQRIGAMIGHTDTFAVPA